MPPIDPHKKSGGLIIEQKQFGATLRVTAIDAATGTEVVFQLPVTASSADIQRMAISKMGYVLKKTEQLGFIPLRQLHSSPAL